MQTNYEDIDDQEQSREESFQWTQDQKEWLNNWVTEWQEHHCCFGGQINWRKCIKDMETDSKASQLFTVVHQDRSKLREFGKRFNQEKNSLSILRLMR
jgi:hypothetical protein